MKTTISKLNLRRLKRQLGATYRVNVQHIEDGQTKDSSIAHLSGCSDDGADLVGDVIKLYDNRGYLAATIPLESVVGVHIVPLRDKEPDRCWKRGPHGALREVA